MQVNGNNDAKSNSGSHGAGFQLQRSRHPPARNIAARDQSQGESTRTGEEQREVEDAFREFLGREWMGRAWEDPSRWRKDEAASPGGGRCGYVHYVSCAFRPFDLVFGEK